MTLSEALNYCKLLRRAGFHATAMWHWGASGYGVAVSNTRSIISTKSEMIRWIEMHRVERLISEREQEERARSGERVGSGEAGSGTPGEKNGGEVRDHGSDTAPAKPGSDYSI